LFADCVLKDCALSYFSRVDRVLHWENPDKEVERAKSFWRYTLGDIKHLAGQKPIRDHDWLVAFFLGDRDESSSEMFSGRDYLLSFRGLTNAALQLEMEFAHRPSIRNYEFQDTKSFIRGLLLPFFDECESEDRPDTYPGQLALTVVNDYLRVEPVDVWPTSAVGGLDRGDHHRMQTRLSLRGFIAIAQIREFERLINRPAVHEGELQEFLEANPEFLKLFGEHKGWMSQVRVVQQILLGYESELDGRPDFLLEDPDGLWDILEIKRADVDLAKGRPPRRGLTEAVHQAIDQVRGYRDLVQDKQQLKWVRSRYGIDLIHPRLYVLIGRDASFLSRYEKKRLVGEVEDVRVITYDDLLTIARRRWLGAPECRVEAQQ
jgi:hypothetical protein